LSNGQALRVARPVGEATGHDAADRRVVPRPLRGERVVAPDGSGWVVLDAAPDRQVGLHLGVPVLRRCSYVRHADGRVVAVLDARLTPARIVTADMLDLL